MENLFTVQEYEDVAIDDNIYVDQDANNEFAVFLFKNKNDNNVDNIIPTWKGKSDIAPSDSIAKLQIYNRNSTAWEDLDNDNITAADTEFILTGSQTTNLSNYYDGSYWVACRIYQEAT